MNTGDMTGGGGYGCDVIIRLVEVEIPNLQEHNQISRCLAEKSVPSSVYLWSDVTHSKQGGHIAALI